MATSYKYKARLVRCHQLLDIGKQQQKKVYLGIFKAPLHIIYELLTQFLLGRLRHRLEGYYSNSRISRSFSSTIVSSTALEVPSVVVGVSLGASGFGSFDVPGMSVFGKLAVEFSINPITGDSGVDRVVVSESLCIQLWKSWI